MPKKKLKKLPGNNPAHMHYVQEARRSHETGAHGPTKREEHRFERKKIKIELRKNDTE